MGFQTTHNGPIGQCFQFRHHWPILGPLGPPLGAPKRPLHEQVKPFWKPKIHVPGPNCIVPVVTTLTEHSGPNLVTLGHTMIFSWAKRPNLVLFGASKRLDLSKWGPLGATRGAPKVQKSVSDAYPGNIGHLDHYVVFVTPSTAVQDIRVGKIALLGPSRPPFDYP